MAKTARKTEEKVETKGQELNMTAAQQKKVDELPNVSERIRFLAAEGYTRGQITKLIPNAHGGKLLYQHVRNVLVGPTPKAATK